MVSWPGKNLVSIHVRGSSLGAGALAVRQASTTLFPVARRRGGAASSMLERFAAPRDAGRLRCSFGDRRLFGSKATLVAAAVAGSSCWLRSSRLQRALHAKGSVACLASSAAVREQRVFRPQYKFVSVADEAKAEDGRESLPEMSLDGGGQAEFEYYWAMNSQPCILDEWVERCSHPQVNAEAYWYNTRTGDIVWQRPDVGRSDGETMDLTMDKLSGDGPAWKMSITELKEALAYGKEKELGLSYKELARRAVAEYEQFVPRVLSWHDFQYITFWFFGGLKKEEQRSGPRDSSFFRKGASSSMFAPRPFFDEAAKLIGERLGQMHPIPMTYFIWTFTRAGIVLPQLMTAIGDHFCDGHIPMCDRCSLGTMLWNFGKQRVSHDKFFEDAAVELSRPNRVRSWAPRNYQNAILAYSWNKHQNQRCFDALVSGMRRLMDGHKQVGPKLDRALLFPYTCKDGSEVLADSFRISSLTVILGALHRMAVQGSAMDASATSMVDYVCRSVKRSPPMMRENGDACQFFAELASYARDVPTLNIRHLLAADSLNYSLMCKNASPSQKQQLQEALRRIDVEVQL
eukprot:TRINITY_DN29803_c0_g1_i1.p1 TRINITY_DN29803_c0_g1~~TRINITY_DN29803_c0_g1_i1.p1  ORF type:complete len:583 (+),score=86.29 TRINITY_DN29803_c0_g1_i1:30-1751(+)